MTKMRPPAHLVPMRIMRWIGATSGLLWVIAEYSCAIDVASEFLIQVYGSAPISSQHF
jgi:hypothetical protein